MLPPVAHRSQPLLGVAAASTYATAVQCGLWRGGGAGAVMNDTGMAVSLAGQVKSAVNGRGVANVMLLFTSGPNFGKTVCRRPLGHLG